MPREIQNQPGSALCFVCGTKNPRGLGIVFQDDGERVFAEFTPSVDLQSWPGVLHGGIISTVLDETIGRVAFLHDRWVQTAKLEVRFTKPAPLGVALRAEARLDRNHRRLMEMSGAMTNAATGEIVATATGTFVPLPDHARDALAKQLGGDFEAWEQWLSTNRSPATT